MVAKGTQQSGPCLVMDYLGDLPGGGGTAALHLRTGEEDL